MTTKSMKSSAAGLLKDLVALSRKYGSDPSHIIAGGGNTSVKKAGCLFIKASGRALATIDATGFLELKMMEVLGILDRTDWSKDRDVREDQIVQTLLDARVNPPDLGIRPSVESTLHALMPQTFVLHTHGELANGVACSKQGPDAFAKLTLPKKVRPVWIPYVDPGMPLAQTLAKALKAYKSEHHADANTVFMGKHGILTAADTAEEADALMRILDEAIGKVIRARTGRKKFEASVLDSDLEAAVIPALRSMLSDPTWLVRRIEEPVIDTLLSRQLAHQPALLPDQVVYCGTFPLWVPRPKSLDPVVVRAAVQQALDAFVEKHKRTPQVYLVEGLGAYAGGGTEKDLVNTAEMFASSMRIHANTLAFGGPNPLTVREYSFIDTWTVEKYRRVLASGAAAKGRASGLVALVTGAGQGVGKEIAEELAGQGARLVLVDLNPKTLEETAIEINTRFGKGIAVACQANVTSEADLRKAVRTAVKNFGGLDIAIANAGILKAYKVTEFPSEVWRSIIDVNLVGVFLCAKTAAEVMVFQRSGNIIQINSKSGKIGSKYNSAYAASKFAGIGLVQSLALDLVEDGVRVNAICPGNFLDLPLWSAPGGLFDQYRAKYDHVSREEVRRIYEEKVPMRRGCRVSDVVRTILYIVEQEYETGQAYNVTGGQEMR
jgi:NAD(P)-dependent dehydrogenase (short-subunit alcohol dehydrogenase family)/rhamnose utilization protein RhaD (predicted bifunctional aldolase and dehydrogenase)